MSDFYHLVQDLVKRYPFLNADDTKRMLEIEAERQRDHSKHMSGRSCPYPVAFERAQKQIAEWLTVGHTYAVNVADLDDLARFVCSHGTACVWAVLIGKKYLPAPSESEARS